MTMRVGVCLLPEYPWARDADRWRECEQLGFTTIWTYDHLSWRSLRDGPWYAAMPLLTAAAGVTSRARLGTLVASPNFRHPVPFAKDVMTLDDIAGGRVDLGLGAGTPAQDAAVLGLAPLTSPQRMDRFVEFVDLLDTLLRDRTTDRDGEYFTAVDARMIPGSVQQPRVPFTVAATGARGFALAARHAQTWVTYGPPAGDDDPGSWWDAVRRQRDRLVEACHAVGRDPAEVRRMALISLENSWAQHTPEAWDTLVERLEREDFTDVTVHWPRPQDPSLPGPTRQTFAHITSTLTGGN
jgi:alkanesulfonate monooxygenase SsuD/methylene tetrahydromethanopterin reductase-like flavin-dependent oxidoreductase (luciferase family)